MIGYLSCELRRLLHRFPRWLMLLLCLGGLTLCAAIFGQTGLYGEWGSFAYVAAIKAMIKPLSLIIGIIELFFVFGDDLKAKTMQAAIGTGLSRTGLVLGKFLEIILLTLLDVIVYAVFIIAFGALFQAGLLPVQLRELSVYFFVEWLKTVGYMSLTMILLFCKRSLGLALVLYIALYAKVLHTVARLLLSVKAIDGLHLSRYTLTASIDTLQTYLIGGLSGVGPLCIVLAYCVLGCTIALLVFQKRELEL
ncbi:MAG: hypothetical protein PHC80_06600 [Eubacteriales bacterium]|nr:hypothetical protein [Eubacteriales bacterium]